MPTTLKSILALDVGNRRVGVAISSLEVRLPRPLTTLEQGDTFFESLGQIIEDEGAVSLVVGLPRGLDGQHTSQTTTTEEFVTQLKEHVQLPIHLQDEALTSQKAKTELEGRGKNYEKGDIDALAATYILQDFLTEHAELEELKR